MKSVREVLLAAEKRFDKEWRSWLIDGRNGPVTFPLGPPDRTTVTRDQGAVISWMQAWRTWLEGRDGVSIVPTQKVNTAWGVESFHHSLVFTRVDDLVKAVPSRAKTWRKALDRWPTLLSFGVQADVVRRHLATIVSMPDVDFEILLAAAHFFREQPRSGLMPRQVPVAGMHTKWLKRHRRLVLALLGATVEAAVIGRDDPAQEPDDLLQQTELDPLGLVVMPRLVDIVLVSPPDRSLVGGLKHLRAPVAELARLDLNPAVVLIVENKESALVVEDTPGLLVIHSLGKALPLLVDLPWLYSARLLYWGDLDRTGLVLLSRARALFPQVESVLMTQRVIDDYRHLGVPDEKKADKPVQKKLTEAEEAVLLSLTASEPGGKHFRLEQERLPMLLVRAELSRALSSPRHQEP